MKSENLIEIASFSYPHEAHIAQASLESAGIPVFLTDEHTINMQWLYSNAMGGVRLHVPREYEAEAKALLATDFTDSLGAEVQEEEVVCPYCGSHDVEPYTIGKKPAFVIFLLLGFPLFFYKHGIKCKQCGRISSNNYP